MNLRTTAAGALGTSWKGASRSALNWERTSSRSNLAGVPHVLQSTSLEVTIGSRCSTANGEIFDQDQV